MDYYPIYMRILRILLGGWIGISVMLLWSKDNYGQSRWVRMAGDVRFNGFQVRHLVAYLLLLPGTLLFLVRPFLPMRSGLYLLKRVWHLMKRIWHFIKTVWTFTLFQPKKKGNADA